MKKGTWLNAVLLGLLLPTLAFAFGFITTTVIEDGTILGVDINSTDTGIWTFENITVTGVTILGGGTFNGHLTNAQILLLTCAAGKGACWAISTTEGDPYFAQSAVIGDYRNGRTGKAP